MRRTERAEVFQRHRQALLASMANAELRDRAHDLAKAGVGDHAIAGQLEVDVQLVRKWLSPQERGR